MTASPAVSELPRSLERLAIAALTLVAFAAATNVQVLGALGPFWTETLEIDRARFGSLMSVASFGAAAGALVLLPIVDRIGRRLPLLAGLSVFLIGSLGHVFAHGDYDLLLWMRAVTGFSGGIVFTVATATVADLVPYERRGQAMVIFNLAMFLAVPVGNPIAIAFARGGHSEHYFYVQAVLAVVALCGLWATVPVGLGRGQGGVQWGVVRAPHVLPAIAAVLIYSGVFATVVQNLGIWLASSGLVEKDSQATVWIALGLLSAFGTVWLARYADRIGKLRFVVGTGVVVALGLLVLPFVSSSILLLLLGVPVATCAAARSGALLALISGLVGTESRGSLMVLRSVAVNVGIACFLWLGGILYENVSFMALSHAAAGAVLVSVVVVAVGVREVGR